MTGKKSKGWALTRTLSFSLLAALRDCSFDESNRVLDGSVYSQFRGIEQGGVVGADQRRRAAAGIAGVAGLDVGKDGGEIALVANAGQFGMATPGANQRRCSDEQLGGGVGGNNGADITAIENGTPGLGGKGPLHRKQCSANGGVSGDDGGSVGVVTAHQIGVVEKVGVELPGGAGGGFGVIGTVAGEADRQACCAVKLAGIEMWQAEAPGKGAGDSALAARSWAIDGDDEWRGVDHRAS